MSLYLLMAVNNQWCTCVGGLGGNGKEGQILGWVSNVSTACCWVPLRYFKIIYIVILPEVLPPFRDYYLGYRHPITSQWQILVGKPSRPDWCTIRYILKISRWLHLQIFFRISCLTKVNLCKVSWATETISRVNRCTKQWMFSDMNPLFPIYISTCITVFIRVRIQQTGVCFRWYVQNLQWWCHRSINNIVRVTHEKWGAGGGGGYLRRRKRKWRESRFYLKGYTKWYNYQG